MGRILAYFAAAVLVVVGSSTADARETKKREVLIPGAPIEEQLTRHDHYQNRRGVIVHAPSTAVVGGVPEGATARCGDGTYSFSPIAGAERARGTAAPRTGCGKNRLLRFSQSVVAVESDRLRSSGPLGSHRLRRRRPNHLRATAT